MKRTSCPWPTAPYPLVPQQPVVAKHARQHLTRSHISLKQWNTLLAVVHHGSFARAAEVLHISQPAISYTIAKLEERLGISILEPDGRRAAITDAGLK
ncbi:MAG TPA: LysR family transcriptional regulator, partial [Noviherbaspirillum sp.]|nr:LysR family transcriptional regulator [Noviherbaspirillum sp.]